MKNYLLLAAAGVLFIAFGRAYPQSTGKIMGTVKDKITGEPIPFSNVLIHGVNTGAAADIDGKFFILNIPPGVYEVTASCVGYQKVTIKDVRVNVNFTTPLEFELSSGEVSLDAVIVQGERNPLIRQDLTNPTVAITSETIDILPVSSINDVIRLQAGVVTGDDGSMHVRGGYGNEIAFSLNGLSMNDPYGNARAVGVATNAVQEVSVSTGTFSAEFGNALSGVVNYVTKEGGEKFNFSLRGYGGDYVSSRKELYKNIDDIDPLNRGRIEATFGGPLLITKSTKFFMSTIYENYKGLHTGIRLYNPTDSYLIPNEFSSTDSRKGTAADPYYFNPFAKNSNGLPTGDGAYVQMNTSESWNYQANISQKFGSLIKARWEIVLDKGKSRSFNSDEGRSYLFNPDGKAWNYSSGIMQALDVTHTVNEKIFYTIKGSYSLKEAETYLYRDTNDPRFLPSIYRRTLGNTMYYTGGTENDIVERSTLTKSLKGDLVAQLFDVHEVKMGFELRKHTVKREGWTLQFFRAQEIDGVITETSLNLSDILYDSNLTILRRTEKSASTYEKEPWQVSGYIQDKIELMKSLILNVGLRYEYFDANTRYNAQLSRDLIEMQSGYLNTYLEPVSIKHMFSPRFSVSYPITDRGVIRFSYGHFYQIGSLEELYRNDKRWVPNVASVVTFGNPNVNPQRSVQYELGLQQQLMDDLKFDLTGYYKDVRDYIFTQTVYTQTARQYRILTNLAYSNVKGITLSFIKRRAPGELFSATLDYTFQIAEGNRTEPQEDLFFSEASGRQTETYLVPLSFDRNHLVNGTITLSDPDNWAVGLIYNLQTGTPYTPQLPPSLSAVTYEQRSAAKPFQWNVDLKLEKFFTLGPLKYSLFVQVENLFDVQNDAYVYASSGKALYNIEEVLNANQFVEIKNRINRKDAGMIDIKEVESYYSNRSERVSPPREIRVGFSILFN